jgi:SSS family solute:Na+ symporter
MVRFYYSNHIRSVPEYLRLRYDHRSHLLNSLTFLLVTVLMSGINMYALALVCQQMLGWSFHFSIFTSAAVVVTYTFLGGLSSSIYNEVLQFFLILAGFLPLTFLGLREVGGWSALTAKLPATMTHTWTGLAATTTNPFGIKWYTILVALTFIMGPAYWCTDFLLVQRALAARDLNAARRTPLIATLPKMLFPLLVTVPGMVAAVVIPGKLQGNFNLALPLLMHRYYTIRVAYSVWASAPCWRVSCRAWPGTSRRSILSGPTTSIRLTLSRIGRILTTSQWDGLRRSPGRPPALLRLISCSRSTT